MTADVLSDIPRRFEGKRIVIVGDLVADQFLHGTITRVSREAPVFILRHEETDTRAGGAANTAVNIASLGGTPVLLGAVGDDENGRLLLERLGRDGVATDGVVITASRGTTTKIRVLAGQHYAPRQQVIRIDHEPSAPLDDESRGKIRQRVMAEAATADAIVLSDYNYGVIDDELFAAARQAADERSIPLLADSRFRLATFRGATSATPNEEEVEQLLGGPIADTAGLETLRQRLGLDALLVTRGNKGMILIEQNAEPCEFPVVGAAEPVDVTGAGDTVIAAYSLSLAAGASYRDAARIANHAGAIVVMKKGTAAASADELTASLERHAKSRT